MSSNSTNPPEDLSSSSNVTQTPIKPYESPMNGTSSTIGRSRALRARPSDPGPSSLLAPTPKTPITTPVSVRAPTPKEFNQISRRLGDENIREKRDELLVEKEKQLKRVLDSHDDAIREQFHLERFVTMITGWDPQAAKVDNSPVFLDWKEQRHNLLSLLPPSASLPSGPASAGPSRPTSSVPARTTRRLAHEQSEILNHVVTPAAPMIRQISPTKFIIKGNGVSSSSASLSDKAKGKRRASEVPIDEVQVAEETPTRGKPGRKPRQSVSTAEMPPPPIPTQAKKGKASRRTTMGASAEEIAAEVEVKEEIQDPGGDGKGRKRARQSLPNLPAAKKTRQHQIPAEEQVASPSPVIETSTPREPSPSPTPAPAPLPSLAHLPFPPPPKRPIERLRGSKTIQYTDPSQKPPSSPKYDGHISPILESCIHLEDSGPTLDLKTLESRAAKDGYFRARVVYLQSHGRLQRLLDEAEDDQVSLTISKNTSKSQSSKLPPRKTDYQDSLMAHMIQVRNAMLNEAKMKPVVCKRIARMIQVYWERIESREERERLAEEKEKKRLGKELIKGLRKRWALAVKIVRAKLLEIQKIEQDRLGKEHLQNILQRSTGLLEAQVTGPELDEDGGEDSDDNVSDATEDVSAAEDSDEGEGLAEGEEGVPVESSVPPETPLEDEDEDLENEEGNEEIGEPGETPAEVHVDTLANAQSSQNIATDKSLLDDRLPETPTSPQLIIEGKRQRRVRSVWSPDEKTPQHLSSSRRPKIEVVEDQEQESSPEPTSSEEEEESSDEEDENEEEGGKHTEVDEEGPRVKQPFLLRGTLRPYQQAGLEWLASLWENGMNGILADEMGLGKTIQTISLLGHLACDKGIWGQHLIIVPTSVILNWEMEFKKFLPGFKVLTYYGNQKERKEKRVGWLSETSWQVCITSYQIVLADQHIFRRKNWSYLILDEAHNIKNFRSQRWQTLLGFKASRRLLLTGTPLQNNLMELWSLLYFLMPGGIGADATAVVGFANHKEFMEWFSNPMDKAIETGDAMDEETLATVSKLHTLLRPFILRRLKSEVETQLPGKFEHVVYCKLSKRQRFLYDEFMSRSSTKEALTTGGYLGVMNTLMQLRKVCNHPDLFEVRPVRTSFAMDSVARDFEPQEILVRQRLLAEEDNSKVDIFALGMSITTNELESGWVCRSRQSLDASDKLPHAVEPVITRRGKPPAGPKKDTRTVEGWLKYQAWAQEQASILRWKSLRDVNRRRCSPQPIYGSTFLNIVGHTPNYLLPLTSAPRKDELFAEYRPPASNLVLSLPDRAKTLDPIIDLFAVIPPNVVARDMSRYALPNLTPSSHPLLKEESFDTLHRSTVKLQIAFPDSSLLQYDCGKLQTLYTMLRDLKAGGHRVLIFTQMTRVLDILEIFLSYNGHRYLRLDGSTKIEDRQVITERFNSDPRYFVFIASSRSGGVGINLTGADTVFFYDSDWNPSMDRQCMDRAHRIGQTREVHIYRFVSSHTVEENMLKKAEQKRLLDKMVIQQGEFNNDWWGRVGWKDMFGDVNEQEVKEGKGGEDRDGDGVVDVDVEGTPTAEEITKLKPRVGEERELARVLAQVEDEEDVAAAKIAQNENELDFQEFDEVPSTGEAAKKHQPQKVSFDVEGSNTPITPQTPAFGQDGEEEGEGEGEYEDDGIGAIDEYMLKWVEADWMTYFIGFRA
ncbi:hypothetical protein V865_001309 [Kwoniella europaea PYCC6329]|uniref:Helicase SWR1 n=1 Tax=Kwoniella europaea PYCC6329 TaxID=1423913 RepID=A0AAX4KBP4_9TREE